MRVLVLLALAACQAPEGSPDDATDTDAAPTRPLRVVFLSDTHIIGPQYTCCSESNGVDNDSIVRTGERLRATVDRINAIQPPPDHVFVLGDIVHDAHHGTALDWYDDNDNAWSIAADLFARVEAPVHFVWGNHDYEVKCGERDGHHPRAFTHELQQHFMGAPTHGVVDAGRWQFVMMNSQLGPTWDPAGPDCSTGTGSFGEEQLAWLDETLATGKPSVVLTHHHLLTSIAYDENDGPNPDITTVMGRHANTRLHLAGHLHRWYELQPTEVIPVRHLILGATRYDDDNFWVVDFGAEDFEILDFDKSQWFTTCADTWSYDGSPMSTGVEELGDCSI
jgi:3',5'-cyclic AMP phosphodiesterase CpdA